MRDGNIGAVDFGIMGRLDRKTRYYLADMLLGFLERDYRRVADVHFAAGFVPADQSREDFTQACRSIGEPIFGRPLAEISFADVLGQLLRLSETFEMEAQPQLLLLQKNMLMAEGVSRQFNPELNIWTLAQPLDREMDAREPGTRGARRAGGQGSGGHRPADSRSGGRHGGRGGDDRARRRQTSSRHARRLQPRQWPQAMAG